MKLAFLVYDSRSGSTLLSREIAGRLPGVFVTPEIRLDALFGRPARWWQTMEPARVVALLEAGRVPEKLGLDRATLPPLVDGHRGVRALIEALLVEARRREGGPAPATALIKSGLHLAAAGRLLADLPDARFLFIVRDPRAAIASKLTTGRPYHPGQVMAWAGPFAAALQWRLYARRARALARRAPLHALRYESFLERHAETLAAVADFLGEAQSGTGRAYRIPPAEHGIHARVLAGGVDAARAEAWRSSLSPADQAVIERVCGAEMRRWGYAAELRSGPIRAAALLAAAAATTAVRVAREFAARAVRRLRR